MSIKSIGQNTAKALIVVHLVTSQIDAEIAYAILKYKVFFLFFSKPKKTRFQQNSSKEKPNRYHTLNDTPSTPLFA